MGIIIQYLKLNFGAVVLPIDVKPLILSNENSLATAPSRTWFSLRWFDQNSLRLFFLL